MQKQTITPRKKQGVENVSRQEESARRFMRKQRLANERKEAEERFTFKPEIAAPLNAKRLTNDQKRIQQYQESDNQNFMFTGELVSAIRAMAMCAGNTSDDSAPWDMQFMAAMQRVSDYHLGRSLPTESEWQRVCTIDRLWDTVKRILDWIDEMQKANRAGFEPSGDWFRSFYAVPKAAPERKVRRA